MSCADEVWERLQPQFVALAQRQQDDAVWSGRRWTFPLLARGGVVRELRVVTHQRRRVTGIWPERDEYDVWTPTEIRSLTGWYERQLQAFDDGVSVTTLPRRAS